MASAHELAGLAFALCPDRRDKRMVKKLLGSFAKLVKSSFETVSHLWQLTSKFLRAEFLRRARLCG